MGAMTDTEPSDLEVVVTFSPEEHALISEHAAELNVSVETYVQQAAARQARDGQLKRQLLQEAAQRQQSSAERFGTFGPLIDDVLATRRDPDTLTEAEKEARVREAARECGIDYTDEVRELGNALWAKIDALHHDISPRSTNSKRD